MANYGQPPYGQPGYGAPPGQPGQWGAPQVDPQVQAWFMAVDADRSGRISALELQQALVNGNWSHFNPETCRLMIAMFDKDQTGQIELPEFQALWSYIQQWKGVFERFDGNRTGSIEAHELGQALTGMGYNFSPQFHQMCITKFDFHGRRSMNLDQFIQCCVMVKSLTDMFSARDTQRAGRITVSYEDFMTMAVMTKI
ncbi:peflin-like isoform X2 [Mya arenaria]|uniref:peflin-like isoform X2 n=1 Tax=Mya arenaria TaxID=6604 RepID=UPI0022E7B323|nr:peflin-like isoform X2 [Mya arenaria]XP_052764190.1 peflin-like isoform X2 [Mya arenaria]